MTLTPAHLVTIKNDTTMGDFDVACLCGWKGGSHVFEDQAERARDKHYRDAIAAGPVMTLSKEQAQSILGHLADVLAAATEIKRLTAIPPVIAKTDSIIKTVISISALIPAPEKESHDE